MMDISLGDISTNYTYHQVEEKQYYKVKASLVSYVSKDVRFLSKSNVMFNVYNDDLKNNNDVNKYKMIRKLNNWPITIEIELNKLSNIYSKFMNMLNRIKKCLE